MESDRAESAAAIVRAHFANPEYVGLILPDGWFGRPYDNMLTLDGAVTRDDELVISFDRDMRIVMRGEMNARVEDSAVKISGFSELVWSWRPYGSREDREQIYTSGTLQLLRM